MLLLPVYTCNSGRVGHRRASELVTNVAVVVVVVVLFTLVIVKMLAVVVPQGK